MTLPPTSARMPGAVPIASRVTSSWVGPIPPQTTTASADASISRIAVTIRPRLSPTLRCSIVSIPTAASCSPIHEELVSTIWPSSSSVPIARTSARTRGLPPAPAHDVEAGDDRERHRDPEDRELQLGQLFERRQHVAPDREHLQRGLHLAELPGRERHPAPGRGRPVDRHEHLARRDESDRDPPDVTARDQGDEAPDGQE